MDFSQKSRIVSRKEVHQAFIEDAVSQGSSAATTNNGELSPACDDAYSHGFRMIGDVQSATIIAIRPRPIRKVGSACLAGNIANGLLQILLQIPHFDGNGTLLQRYRS